MLIDPELRFHDHVWSVVWKAGGLAGELLRSTVCHTQHFMVSLFVSHIRPIMDFGSSVWNVGYLGDIKLLESVQRRWTRQIADISHLGYEDRLKALGVFSIYGRLLWADSIKCWKIFNEIADVRLRDSFTLAFDRRFHGHSFKVVLPRCDLEMRIRFFLCESNTEMVFFF